MDRHEREIAQPIRFGAASQSKCVNSQEIKRVLGYGQGLSRKSGCAGGCIANG